MAFSTRASPATDATEELVAARDTWSCTLEASTTECSRCVEVRSMVGLRCAWGLPFTTDRGQSAWHPLHRM